MLSLFVLIGNPLIVLIIMSAMGYRKRTGLLAGLTVAQISEFSLIFMAMGVAIGHVADDALGLVTLVGLITIAASTYMITYSHELYDKLEPFLGIFERKRRNIAVDEGAAQAQRHDVILFGLGRYGLAIARALEMEGKTVLGVDFSPEAVRFAQARGLKAVYGDASDPEFLSHLSIENADWLVLAVPEHATGLTHYDPRLTLLRTARDLGYKGRVAVAAHHDQDNQALQALHADLVLMPFRDAASAAATMILDGDAPAATGADDPTQQRELVP